MIDSGDVRRRGGIVLYTMLLLFLLPDVKVLPYLVIVFNKAVISVSMI